MYVQLAFALDRVKALAPEHPEWKTTEPFAAALAGDVKGRRRLGREGSPRPRHRDPRRDDDGRVRDDRRRLAREGPPPRFARPYTDTVYQPMLELLAYLGRTGSRRTSSRAAASRWSGPSRRGSTAFPQSRSSARRSRRSTRQGRRPGDRPPSPDRLRRRQGREAGGDPEVHRTPPHPRVRQLGRRLRDARVDDVGPGPRLGLILRHDDDAREYAYDRKSRSGASTRRSTRRPRRGWQVVSMKDDWKATFRPEPGDPSPSERNDRSPGTGAVGYAPRR